MPTSSMLHNGAVERFLLQTLAELESQRDNDQEPVHFTASLAAHVIDEFTSPGDLVLDPFAGYGTTLVTAERLGRQALGVELLPERVQRLADRLSDTSTILTGDARDLVNILQGPGLGEVALVLTSPPYMTRNDHPENPLDAYTTTSGHYESYLVEIGDVFAQVATVLRPGGHAVVNVANIRHRGVLTTLAWDMAGVIARHLTLVQECYLAWDSQPDDISGDYCLVFRRDRDQPD